MNTFRKFRILTICFLFCSICEAENADSRGRKWTSPDETQVLHLIRTDGSANNPPNISIATEASGTSMAVSESEFIASPIRREYAGTAWLQDTPPYWTDNRYAVFEDPDHALCIIDAGSRKMLLNTVFEALSDGPESNRWVAIRYRPTTRNQERLHGTEADTLFIIDLPDVVTASKTIREPDKRLFGNLKSIRLPGIALARPLWKNDQTGNRILVSVWEWSKRQAEVLSFDPSTLRLLHSANLNLAVPETVSFSPWIDKHFESKVLEAISHAGL